METHSETVTVTTQEGASADLHLSYTVQTPNFRVTVSTEAIDFGAVEVGYAQPAPRSISFTNEDDYKISLNGTSELRVEWSKSGFVYSHGHMSARIAPHETVTYTVQPQAGLKPGIYIQHVRGNFTSSHIGGDTFQSFDIPVTFIVAAEGDPALLLGRGTAQPGRRRRHCARQLREPVHSGRHPGRVLRPGGEAL